MCVFIFFQTRIIRFIHHRQVSWKAVSAGAFATTILFLPWKFAISFYISKTNVGSMYGAAGALVVFLLWIYYSSVILFFGAEFTLAYVLLSGRPIKPTKFAVAFKEV